MNKLTGVIAIVLASWGVGGTAWAACSGIVKTDCCDCSCDPGLDPDCPEPDAGGGQVPGGSPSTGGVQFSTSIAVAQRRQRERQESAALEPIMVASNGDAGGLFAEDTPANWAYWGSGLGARFESDADAATFDADLSGMVLGADRIGGAGHVVGGALGLSRTDAELDFESARQSSDELVVLAYGVRLLGPASALDLVVEYAQSKVERDFGNGSRSEYDGRRGGLALNLRRVDEWAGLYLSSRVGAQYSAQQQPSHVEQGQRLPKRQLEIIQALIGVELAYPAWEQGELYTELGYRYDFERSELDLLALAAPDDEDDFEWLLGLRHRFSARLSVSLGANGLVGRDNYSNTAVQVLLRWEP